MFTDWLFPLSIMPLKFFQVVHCINCSSILFIYLLIFISVYFNSSIVTYGVLLVAGVQHSDSALPYITWCSLQQVYV